MQILVLAAIVAGITSLDSVHLCQWLLARPIVIAPLIGAIMGDPGAGMLCGAWIELIWLGVLPIGNYTPPDAHLTAASAATAAAVWGGGGPVSLVAVLATVPLGVLSKKADLHLRHQLALRAETMLETGPPYRLGGMFVASVAPVMVKAALAIVMVGVVSAIVSPLVGRLVAEPRVVKALIFSASLIPALGMVQLARCIGASGRERWIGLGAIAAAIAFFGLAAAR
jgi:mannose/fructose/N-acetylgalactosamine-specific phosphotransferase system component IIC